MKPTVLIAFDLTLSGSGDFFTLDDPVKGVLSPYIFLVQDDGGIGYWRMEESAGTVARNFIGDVDGVYRNQPGLGAGPLAPGGNSVQFNGTTQWLSIGVQTNINLVTTDSWTVEAWFIADDVFRPLPQLIWEEGGDDSGVSLYVYQGAIYGLMWTGDTIRKQISHPITSETMFHVVFVGTNTGNRCDLYLNGEQVGTPTVNEAVSLIPSAEKDALLLDDPLRGKLNEAFLGGADANGIARANGTTRSHIGTVTNGWYFEGRIGDVARYDVALSTEQVETHYEASAFTLAGDVFTDVTDDTRSVRVRRGRSSETQDFNASEATIVLDNRNRLYDPLSNDSPYADSIIPRKAVLIDLNGRRIFSGQVEDFDLEYEINGDSTNTVDASDGFALLNQQAYSASANGPTGLVSSAIQTAAINGGWFPQRLNLDAGTSNIGANIIQENSTVLSYLQLLAGSDAGLLFIDRRGRLAFRDRTSGLLRTDILFSDAGNGIPFTGIEVEYGTEFLYTRAVVEWVGGEVSAEDPAASRDYGLTTIDVKTVLATQQEAETYAQFLVNRYRQPTVRIRSLTINFDILTVPQQDALNRLDMGSIINVQFTPNNVGDPIIRELAIDGIEHDITPGAHEVSYRLFEPFLIKLDGSVLGLNSLQAFITGSPNLNGDAEGTSSTTGFVLGAKGKAGRADGLNTTTGTVTGTKNVSGEVLGENGSTGTVIGLPGVLGSVTGTSSTAGSVTGAKGKAGTVTGTSSTTGFVTGAKGKTGSVTGSSGTSGTVIGLPGVRGTVLGTSSTTGTVLGAKGKTGTVTGTSTTNGTATGQKNTTGLITGTNATNGTATGTPDITGTIPGANTSNGTATGTPGINGSTTASSSTTGTATGAPNLTGSSSGDNTSAGTATGAKGTSGSVLGTSGTTGTVIGTTAIFRLNESKLDEGLLG